jgi:uncharacterized protein with PIN domain
VLRLRHGAAGVERFWQFLADVEIEVIPFDEAQVRIAAIAFDAYGKGINPRRASIFPIVRPMRSRRS